MQLLLEQIEDAGKMASLQDLPNFSKAGTGKTYTALEAFRLSKLKRALVLCPKIALGMWAEEASMMLGCSTQIMRTGRDIPVGADMTITTYDLASTLLPSLGELFVGKGQALINDESHYVRSAGAKRTMAVFGRKLDLADGLACRFDQVWNLTGTPMVAYANDLYTQVACLHPEVFERYNADTLSKFERMFTFRRQKQYNKNMQPIWKICGNSNEGILNRIIYQEVGAIRRLEAKGLPPLRERVLTVDVKLTSEMRSVMRGVKDSDIIAAINNPESPIAKVWHMIGLGKVSEVVPYIGELALQSPVLVGVWHTDVGEAYVNALRGDRGAGLKVAHVNGATSDTNRELIRKAFNSGHIDVLVGQMAAMGVSWNIQKACANIVIAEEYPSPSVIEQFYKRVYRYGQENAVQLDYITSDNCIDEALRGVRLRKAKSDLKING